MNSITIAGNITKDAEVRHTNSGEPVANFSIADNQGKDKPAIFWNCQLFGKRATSLEQYLVKGQAVAVSGNISEREWTDKEGNKRKSVDVRINEVALMGGRREEERPKPRRQEEDFEDPPF